ncbi:MAG: aldo/keto reductase [Defluviitaleaceae bacterium]|nr:aldo/keto reductase [Defluviitaleaceae bacterium]
MEPLKQKIKNFYWGLDGRKIPLGLGCAWIGRSADFKADASLLERCYEEGARYFDTSRSYGESEAALGVFFKGIERETFFIATKSRYDFKEPGAFEAFRQRFYQSFERLGVEKIDLFQIHDTENYDVCVDTVIPFLEDRRAEGLIDYIGFGMRSLVEHQKAMKSGRVDSALSYGDYYLTNHGAANAIAEAKRLGICFINSSPMMFGLWKTDAPTYRGGTTSDHRYHLANRMKALCKSIGVDIIAAALQDSLHDNDIDILLNGIARPDNLESTLRAMRTQIFPEQWAQIDALRHTFEDFYDHII